MKELEELRAAINSSNHTAEELKRGFYRVGRCLKCGVDANNTLRSTGPMNWPDDYSEWYEKGYGVWRHDGNNEAGCHGTVIMKEYNIDRRNVSLADTIRALAKKGKWSISELGDIIKISGDASATIQWDLSKTFDSQPPEVISFLASVLCK